MINSKIEKEYVSVLFFIYERNSRNKAIKFIKKLMKLCFLQLKHLLKHYEVRSCVKSVKIVGKIHSLEFFIHQDDFYVLSPIIKESLQNILDKIYEMEETTTVDECLKIIAQIKNEIEVLSYQSDEIDKDILNQKLFFFDQVIKNENGIYQKIIGKIAYDTLSKQK